MEQNLTIQKTEDYGLFERITGNRGVNKSHVKRLKDAINRNASVIRYNPILINDKNQIIDGQHRLEAITSLGLPVYYIQEPGLKLDSVQALNSLTKPWTPLDYARSYSELGNKHYKEYIEFKTRYHLNHDILLAYLGLDESITGVMFKEGNLKVKDPKKSHDLCQKLLEVGEFYPKYNRRSFALAFKRMWSNAKYDHSHLLTRMATHNGKIQDYSIPEDYLRALEGIYNFHLKKSEKRVRLF